MEKITKTIKDLFLVMGLGKAGVDIKKDNSLKDKEVLMADIELNPGEAKQFLVDGAGGLSALQHILRILVFKNNPSRSLLLIDINGYKKEREKILVDLAVKAAQKVRRTKKPVVLEPMSAYERRIIHLKLAEQPDIATESIDEEPERKLVVRLYP